LCSLQQCNPATHPPAHSHTDPGESDTYLNIGTRPLVYTTGPWCTQPYNTPQTQRTHARRNGRGNMRLTYAQLQLQRLRPHAPLAKQLACKADSNPAPEGSNNMT
jgi:hypothetical protein